MDTVKIIGKKPDGSSDVIGEAPMPPKMKMREIASEMFGDFQEGTGSDGEYCMWALEQYHEWLIKQGLLVV